MFSVVTITIFLPALEGSTRSHPASASTLTIWTSLKKKKKKMSSACITKIMNMSGVDAVEGTAQ